MADTILGLARRLNRAIAIAIGFILLACAAFVLLDILLRQVDLSFGGTDEISGYVMAIVTSWGMAFTLLELGHVRIDLIRGRVGSAGRALFDLGSLAVLAATVTLIAYRCWPVVERSINNLSRANTPLETPLWLVQVPWFAGWAWFALMAWVTLLAALELCRQRRFVDSERAIGAFAEQEAVR